MKLISKTILYYLLFSLPLLVLAVVLSYFLIRSEVRDGTDESLWKEKINAEKFIHSFSDIHDKILSSDSLSKIENIFPAKTHNQYLDTMIFDKYEEENMQYRMLKSVYNFGNKSYLITLVKPTLEEDELMEGLFSSLIIIIGVLMLSFFFVSWLLSKWLWKPFYTTISTLNAYEIKNKPGLNFSKTKTKEFDQLNEALAKMTDKMYADFLHQKEFTENASHEMQTPLAVIKAKLDLLIQSENLKEEDMVKLQSIDSSVNKLASLNKALLLLAKIENKQFNENKEISIQQVVAKVLSNYEDMIFAKDITVETDLKKDIQVKINPTLCDILVANLIQNAIRHNNKGGKIKIELSNNSLKISNTGDVLTIRPDELFERFKKNDASKDSLGLGLSIVKGIVDAYELKIEYNYIDNMHVFEIKFV